MWNKLIMALLALTSAGVAGAQVTGSSDGDTNALQARPSATQGTPSSWSETNILQPGPALDQPGALGLGPIASETLDQGINLWPSDKMAVGGVEGGTFVDTDAVRLEGEAFSKEFDLLRGVPRESPISIGRDKDIKFVESHYNRPGIPAPLGMAYPMPQRRLRFFVEVAPILDPSPTTTLGWGGGIGISIYLGR